MNSIIMKSINFEFLRKRWPELASLGGFAEQYAVTDPASAMVKLRLFVESMAQRIYDEKGLPRPLSDSLFDLLAADEFKKAVPAVVINVIHTIRKAGNRAAHGTMVSAKSAQEYLKDAFDLGRWLFIINGGTKEGCPDFQPPVAAKEGMPDETIKSEKRLAMEALAVKEIEMQALLTELEDIRAKTKVAEKKVEELEVILAIGKAAADVLGFDEAATRNRLIDYELTAVGWDVGAKGANTSEVSQEAEALYQPTKTGTGYADYVLRDDNGKPLAVIETKKTAKSAELGQEQARLYADGLEKMHGQRPVIFYTNGFDIYIWDDAQGFPPRKIFGFYSKDSLQYLIYKRKNRLALDKVASKPEIVDRFYQIEAIKRVNEKFSGGRRKALLVQATGTGKTRVAIALTDLLNRASWVKRVLFLCDRKELRKQAKNAYNEFLTEPMTVVSANTAKDRDKRIYLATYPAMNKIFQTFDVGFFDLIIADESHRSIYNRYLDMFRYFDSLQVGLTATPVDFISRNTFKMFDCEDKTPTAYYSLDEAINDRPPYLVPYEVYTHTTQFLRKGIKYKDLSERQKQQLEEDGEDPAEFDYENHQIDKQIFNRDTNRVILRNLMENGIREETGQYPGKTIIFARNHNHAMLMADVFNELFPQYGGKFCRVIDTYDTRAEQLIDDFKSAKDSDPRIAISVDMLDTGIDVPEIVNLVFAKPIRSLVKFEQMIGRGTRLCPDLFGPGKDKTHFRIFDHWGNFEFFDKHYKKAEPSTKKSLMQQLFEERLNLARTALNQSEPYAFDLVIPLIREDLERLSEDTISVREKWREKRSVSKPETLRRFDPATEQTLRTQMAPLMQWADIRGQVDAYRFDLLVAEFQVELLKKSGRVDDFKAQMLDQISRLQMHLNPVREKAEAIKRVKSAEFWVSLTVEALETIRKELRGIMKYAAKTTYDPVQPKFIDIHDGQEQFQRLPARLKITDMPGYRKQVQAVLLKIFDENSTLQKIKAGEPVSEADLKTLTSLVLTRNPDVDQALLREFFEETAGPLDFAIRSIIGMDAEVVNTRFADFTVAHPQLTANQVSFLNLLKNHISRYGAIEIEDLYEPPFTTLHSEGLDGVFTDERMVEELLGVVESFKPKITKMKDRGYDIV
ncbi:MAG: DEAD/DEAH box helicase family protein [Desulfobacterales bacterium]|nr:DEAD/DEAH box helicase family protein [Desulfobacterales bacterium]